MNSFGFKQERIEDLTNLKWKGKICTRPGSHAYNRSLLASLIAAHGKDVAEQWTRGLVNNLARKPEGNDRAQAKAIFEGVCDIAIMNTYYYGKMKFNEKNPEQNSFSSHFSELRSRIINSLIFIDDYEKINNIEKLNCLDSITN